MRWQGALGPAAREELDPASNHVSECGSVSTQGSLQLRLQPQSQLPAISRENLE